MRLLTLYLGVLLMVFSPKSVLANENGLNAHTYTSDASVFVFISNDSTHDVIVGPLISLGSIRTTFYKNGSLCRTCMHRPNASGGESLFATDTIVLRPGDLYGQAIAIDRLKEFYSLSRGCYGYSIELRVGVGAHPVTQRLITNKSMLCIK